MREIKFRAYTGEELSSRYPKNTMIYNITIHHILHTEMSGMEGDVFDLKDWIKYYQVMQFTGLKDKDGKEIYEGDIVTAWRPRPRHLPTDTFEKIQVTGQVVYEPPSFFLITGVYDDRNWIEFEHNAEPYEIIGNIYENPDLLKSVGK